MNEVHSSSFTKLVCNREFVNIIDHLYLLNTLRNERSFFPACDCNGKITVALKEMPYLRRNSKSGLHGQDEFETGFGRSTWPHLGK